MSLFVELRSSTLINNIIRLYLLKGVGIVINLAYIPILIKVLGQQEFGIWVTVSTLVTWASIFDFGLGNGLRAILAREFASDEPTEKSRKYISTAYFSMFAVSAVVVIIAFLIDNYWSVLTAINIEHSLSTSRALKIYFISFIVRMNLQLIHSILIAKQNTSTIPFLELVSNIVSFSFVIAINYLFPNSLDLIHVSIIYSTPILVALILYTTHFFLISNKHLLPHLSYIRIELISKLFPIGVNYFIIQISSVIIFSSDTILISYFLGSDMVTLYTIAFRYFNIPFMLFSIIAVPILAGIGDAFFKSDFIWIKKTIANLKIFWGIQFAVVLFMVINSKYLISLWVGGEIANQYDQLLIIVMGIWVMIKSWNNIFVYFLNSAGIIKISMISSVLESIINLVLNIIFLKYTSLGILGVVVASCISISDGIYLRPKQYNKVINKNATGLWSM